MVNCASWTMRPADKLTSLNRPLPLNNNNRTRNHWNTKERNKHEKWQEKIGHEDKIKWISTSLFISSESLICDPISMTLRNCAQTRTKLTKKKDRKTTMWNETKEKENKSRAAYRLNVVSSNWSITRTKKQRNRRRNNRGYYFFATDAKFAQNFSNHFINHSSFRCRQGVCWSNSADRVLSLTRLELICLDSGSRALSFVRSSNCSRRGRRRGRRAMELPHAAIDVALQISHIKRFPFVLE